MLIFSLLPVRQELIQRLKDRRGQVKAPRIVEMINVIVDIEIVLQELEGAERQALMTLEKKTRQE